MIKKLILIALLLTYPFVTNADFWSAIGACAADPCNCGDSNSTEWESWNGASINKGKKNKLCPPWNKTAGRVDNTCLIQSYLPQPFIGYYSYLCGEETPESTYMNPKIKVRGQQCNAAACWTTADTLNWDGQCVTLASGYGIPLIRMCARVAIPANYQANFPQDPGYTTGVHLNSEGATVHDDVIIDYTGHATALNSPKLCLYSDPAFLSFSNGFDVMDLNPYKQSAHKTTAIHPVVKVILFFAEAATKSAQTPFQMLNSLFDLMSGGDNSQTTFVAVLKDLFKYIGWIVEQVGNLVITFLQQIGQINRAVDSTMYGCVNIPMGPYPPPYCQTIAAFPQTAYTQAICQKDANGVLLPSTSTNPCVVSTLDNNFVNNSVRISFQNFVPLCTNGQQPTSDQCVTINGIGNLGSASFMHASTGNTDILPPCSSGGSAVCVNTTIPHNCSVSSNGCQSGFRVVYGVTIGGFSTPQSYFVNDIADCPSNNAVACQNIWGINTSEFIDVSLTFPAIQVSPDVTPLQTSVNLTDKLGSIINFVASVVRVSSFDPVLQVTQDPSQICVTQNDIIIGCENRADAITPTVYDCNDPAASLSCTSTYFMPQLVATIRVGTYSTSGIIEPSTVYGATSPANSSTINLAGYDYGSFVTDSSFVQQPFSGVNSPNPGSRYGTYKNNILPVNVNAVYQTGLDYINGSYHLGGRYACLTNLESGQCPANTSLCVLAKFLNSNIVNCQDFVNKSAIYNGLQPCTGSQPSGCSVMHNISGINGNSSLPIYLCGTNNYCYQNPTSTSLCQISLDAANRYIPNSSVGAILSANQYFDINNDPPGYNYDQSKYALRNKTSYENNLCASIPQPKCAAVATYDLDNGFASWPETPVEQIATGTCQFGLFSIVPLKRRCIPDPDNQTVHFEPLYSWNLLGPIPIKIYSNIKCQ